MNQRDYLILLSFAILTGCHQGKAPQQNGIAGEETALVNAADTFRAAILPEIPSILTTPDQRAEFLAEHYWDKSNFADTCYLSHKDATEQAWVDYYNLLNYISLDKAQEVIKTVFSQTAFKKEVYKNFTDLADKYLYDPNSPMRNEEFYIPILESMVASPLLEDVEKIRPLNRLQLAKKNRPGTRALDFTYTFSSGKQGTLHSLSADYTILFINNPGCHACAEAITGLKQSIIINQLLSENRLKILAFYTDTELDNWQKHRPNFPDTWLNAYDRKQTVSNNNLYDLKAIPTLYLLDKDKIVILKDAPLHLIEAWLVEKCINQEQSTN